MGMIEINLNIENLIYEEIIGEDQELYEIVQTQDIDFDGEKGSRDVEIVIKNKEDGTFWQCTVTDWGRGTVELYEDWSQVYPHETKKTVFKSKPA